MNNKQKGNISDFNQNAKKDASGNAVWTTEVDQILEILDVEVEIPDGLVDKVMEKKDSIQVSRPNRFDFSKYLQIAAVLVAAVMLGVLLGKNADVDSFNKKESRQNKALIQLKEEYHLSESHSFGRL